MTISNIRLLAVLIVVCLFCYGNARRIRNLGDLSLAMDIIDQSYVDKPDREALYRAAMSGMIDSLDAHSEYIPPSALKSFHSIFEQEFGGLGVSLDGPPRRSDLTIVATLFNSPAYHAGLRPGDRIIGIDGDDVRGTKFDEASKRLRGREGTPIRLQVERDGLEAPMDITVVRAIIDMESVIGDRRMPDGKWDFHLEDDPQIAYCRLELFGEKTAKELERAISTMEPAPKGIILDLRDNSGGLLTSATKICDMFLNDGQIVTTRGRDEVLEDEYQATKGTIADDSVPIVVIINESSASASEILAGCLKDRNRATIVGKRSYGKGSVQNVIPIEGGNAAMRITTAYYFPPSGRRIHRLNRDKSKAESWGVDPSEGCEIEISNTQLNAAIERFRRRSDPIANGSMNESHASSDLTVGHLDPTLADDPQLFRAVEVVKEKLR